MLTNFKLEDEELEVMHSALARYKKKSHTPFQKNIDHLLRKNWLPLYQYKGKLYLYSPCDGGNSNKRTITDSTLIFWYLEGPYPYIIKSFNKVSDGKYQITSIDAFNNEDVNFKPEDLVIEFDDTRNIAIWKYGSLHKEDYVYRIFVPLEYATKFELIVNYCPQNKHGEFEFEKIDIQKVFNNH
jgi:hypothetical protein